MIKIEKFINSDLLNKFLDKKLTEFQMFLVEDNKKYKLVITDKKFPTEIVIANFASYNKYLRWLTEAAIMRAAADSRGIKQARDIYKKLFAFSRDPMRKDPFKEE